MHQVGIWPYAGIDIAAFELMKEWLGARYAAHQGSSTPADLHTQPPRFPLPTPLGPTLATQVALHSSDRGAPRTPPAPPREHPVRLPSYALLLMGMLSSSLGQLVAYPLSLVRARLQAQGAGGAPAKYLGMTDVLVKVGDAFCFGAA